MPKEPETSILISVYEQLDLTRRCLEALENTLTGKLSYEVLLVDDASSDGTAEYLQSLHEPHRVFINDERKGFAANNNFAASQAKGKYLCLLNNDVFVDLFQSITMPVGLPFGFWGNSEAAIVKVSDSGESSNSFTATRRKRYFWPVTRLSTVVCVDIPS